MNRSESVAALMDALAKAQAEMRNAKESGYNPHRRYNYHTLADVFEAIKQPFANNGISYTQCPTCPDPASVAVTTTLSKGDEYISSTLCVPIEQVKGTTRVQAIGSALTYARRYALTAMCGLAPGDDDDGEPGSNNRSYAVPHSKRPQPPRQPARPRPQPKEMPKPVDDPGPKTILTKDSPWMLKSDKTLRNPDWPDKKIEDCPGWQSFVYHTAAEGKTLPQIREQYPNSWRWALVAAKAYKIRKAAEAVKPEQEEPIIQAGRGGPGRREADAVEAGMRAHASMLATIRKACISDQDVSNNCLLLRKRHNAADINELPPKARDTLMQLISAKCLDLSNVQVPTGPAIRRCVETGAAFSKEFGDLCLSKGLLSELGDGQIKKLYHDAERLGVYMDVIAISVSAKARALATAQ